MRLAPRAVVLAAAVAALLGAAAGPAGAAGPEVGMEDERLLLGMPERAPQVVSDWAAAGVDVVRLHARWSEAAPGATATRRPQSFDPSDPLDPGWHWGELDHAVDLVRASGMRVMLTVTGPGPLWTSRSPRLRNPRYKPDPAAFAQFVRAAATHFKGRVDRYLIWNEPNIPGWLSPQMECRTKRGSRKRTCVAVAPHLYRGLLQAAVPVIRSIDPSAEILAGELAPIGGSMRSPASILAPLTFLRAMACVDERYRRMPARGPCASFRPVVADSIGHHPHGVQQSPDEPSADRRWAKISELGRLFAVLDRLTRMRRMVAPAATGGRFNVHLTEFGYQTSPPDHAVGVTLSQQARYLQQAAYLAWQNPRIRSLVHYQWEDEPVRWRAPGTLAYAGWQSGLHYVDGRPKPAMDSFRSPFVADQPEGSDRARLWGQVRPGARHDVTVLRRLGGGEWTVAGATTTDERGYWTLDVQGPESAEYRFTWAPVA